MEVHADPDCHFQGADHVHCGQRQAELFELVCEWFGAEEFGAPRDGHQEREYDLQIEHGVSVGIGAGVDPFRAAGLPRVAATFAG